MILLLNVLIGFAMILALGASLHVYGRWANPVVFFTLIMLLHNFSYSFTQICDPDYSSFIRYSDDAEVRVMLRNLISYAVACFAILLKSSVRVQGRQPHGLVDCYEMIVPPVVLEFAYVVMFIVALAFSVVNSGGAYGEGQALTAGEAFAPITILLMFRHFFIVISPALRMWLGLPINYVFLWSALAAELLIAMLSGGRKLAFCVLLTVVLLWVIRFSGAIKFRHYLLVAASAVGMIFLSSFIGAMRGDSGGNLVDKSVSALSQMGSIGDVFLDGVNATNSQPLQYWVDDLWRDQHLEKLYGMSYLQAFVNLVVPRPLQGALVDYQAAFVFKREAYADSTSMGYDFAFSAEAFVNFGDWLFWIPYLCLGLVIGWLYARRRDSFLFFYGNVVVVGVCFAFFRTDSTSLMRMIFIAYVPYLLLRAAFGQKAIVKQRDFDI